jgi:hypothetical protein
MVEVEMSLHEAWNSTTKVHIRTIGVIVSLAVGLSLPSRCARAADDAPPARVRLQLDGAACSALRLDDVIPFAQVEVGSRLADANDSDANPVVVKCAGDRITILVTGPDKTPRSYRTDLASTSPSVRPRIVAIAIAEVLHDLDIVPRRPEAPNRVAPIIRRERSLEAPVAKPPAKGATELAAFWQASRFQLDGRWLMGGGIRFDFAQTWWSAGLDAGAAARSDTTELGKVDTLLLYMSPYAAGRWVQGPVTVRLGAGYAFGVGRITGSASSAQVQQDKVTGPWGSPYGLIDFGISPTESVSLNLRGQAGWASISVVGNVDRSHDVDLKGLWTSAQIGIALTL